MTRESRLLLTVVLMSGLGVGGLMMVASQYRKTLTTTAHGRAGGEDASIRAVRFVDGYLAARVAARAVLDSDPERALPLTADATSAYRIDRWNAFTAHGMTYDDYVAVRAAWRTYRSGGNVVDPALVAVFRARRLELEGADLGPGEAWDDAIK